MSRPTVKKGLAAAIAAVAILAAVFAFTPEKAEAKAYFDWQQTWYATSTGWFFFCQWDYDYMQYYYSDLLFRRGGYRWYLDYFSWYGFLVYDYDTGKWDEIVYTYDENW
ncbi:MAG: hypothetical protein BWZ10_03124 [candidate division BRC1 bacterium ADurb.BinA364]|nr:MAG: hypothetical protein BWZ10_03124 [candidate division BRC1 bacterium ADurb.BinA364]